MTNLLKKALEEAARVLSTEEQDSLAQFVLDELEDEVKWRSAFADPRSDRLLARLAAEALEEDEAGRTTPLDPDAS